MIEIYQITQSTIIKKENILNKPPAHFDVVTISIHCRVKDVFWLPKSPKEASTFWVKSSPHPGTFALVEQSVLEQHTLKPAGQCLHKNNKMDVWYY